MAERGKIEDEDGFKQVLDYTGLRYGKGTPTDMDGLLDFGRGRVWIFLEFKYRNARFSDGQRWALEHLVDILLCAGRAAIVILVRHPIPKHLEVPAAVQLVTSCYVGRNRWEPGNGETVEARITRFLLAHDQERYVRAHETGEDVEPYTP